MDTRALVDQMERSGRAIEAWVGGAGDDALRWRPAPGRWSSLEVVCHLADEEREDFRTRIDVTLHRPGESWPPIAPEAWVAERRYAERDPAAALADFADERRRSLAWLAELVARDPAWDTAYEHPRFGPITAGTLLVSWAAHDLLHLRQLLRIAFERTAQLGAPHETRYAGEW